MLAARAPSRTTSRSDPGAHDAPRTRARIVLGARDAPERSPSSFSEQAILLERPLGSFQEGRVCHVEAGVRSTDELCQRDRTGSSVGRTPSPPICSPREQCRADEGPQTRREIVRAERAAGRTRSPYVLGASGAPATRAPFVPAGGRPPRIFAAFVFGGSNASRTNRGSGVCHEPARRPVERARPGPPKKDLTFLRRIGVSARCTGAGNEDQGGPPPLQQE
jgi:hypothetical protein